MSEFNYLTGRPELFENAPADALVVLEHEDGRLFYAIAHDLGAKYWNEDGSPGSKVGLIALHKKTRVIASRVRTGGLRPAEPKRDPIPKSRIERIQQAQNGLKKAISQPFPVAPKPEPKPAPVKIDPPKVAPKRKTPNVACPKCGISGLHACPGAPVAWSEQDKQRLDDAVKQINAAETKPRIVAGDGFVSILGLSKRGGSVGKDTFVTSTVSGNLKLSSSLPLVVGDRVDAQIDPVSGRFRIGKVSSGGYVLTKSRCLTSKALFDMLKKPTGAKSVRVYLTEADGWWQGQAELVGVKS